MFDHGCVFEYNLGLASVYQTMPSIHCTEVHCNYKLPPYNVHLGCDTVHGWTTYPGSMSPSTSEGRLEPCLCLLLPDLLTTLASCLCPHVNVGPVPTTYRLHTLIPCPCSHMEVGWSPVPANYRLHTLATCPCSHLEVGWSPFPATYRLHTLVPCPCSHLKVSWSPVPVTYRLHTLVPCPCSHLDVGGSHVLATYRLHTLAPCHSR